MTTLTSAPEKTAVLPVTPDEAFALLTDPERLRRWKTVSARVDLRAGGAYRFTVTPGHIAAGTFREVEPGRRIVFGWGWEGDDELAPDSSTVTVTIEPVGGGTLVRLVHEGLTQAQAADHLVGWNHYFDRLEEFADTGVTTPDEWDYAPAELTVLTCSDATLAVLQPVLARLTDEDRDKPTPCTELTCHQLAEHLMSGIESLARAAGATPVRPTGSLETIVAQLAQQANEAYAVRGLAGTVTLEQGAEIPAEMAASILSIEYLVHAWDFATGTGQQVHVSPEVSDFVMGLAGGIIPGSRERGAFGPQVAVGPDADALQRLLAFSGRTPLTPP